MTTAAITNQQAPPITVLGRLLQQQPDKPIAAFTVDEIDECIVELESAERLLKAAKATHDEIKDGLITLVKAHGAVPAGAEQSLRLHGRRNMVTITTGTTTTVNEAAVEGLADYCAEQNLQSIFGQLFATETKHKLVDGARTVLAAVAIPRRVHEKVLSLFGRCFDIKTKSPSLKYELIVPVKLPKKARAGKAAA